MSNSASPGSAVPARVRAYVETIVERCADGGRALAGVVLFGSAAIGGWSEAISDVDLILIVPDDATNEAIGQLRTEVERIESACSFGNHSGRRKPALEKFLDKVTAHDRTFFICTRSDLLSGNIERILRIHPLQAIFVDRIVLANFVASGITMWGDAILPLVPIAPIRRFDVLKALFSQFPMALLSAVMFPLYPAMTRYAMVVLKGSVHSCFFCHELRRASLEEEVRFFEGRLGSNPALRQLLDLRREYRNSFLLVVRCIPTLLRLHWRTAFDNRFPRRVVVR